MYHAQAIDEELAHPPADWLVMTRDYATQSGDTAALEPDNANGWYDSAKQEMHLVVPTQSPQEVAEGVATLMARSRAGLKRLFLHPCFTVGYGSKDHSPMPYYGLLAAFYGDGRPVRLANDRFDQFQAGLKRHQFSMRYTIAADRRTGLLQSFQAGIVANGGGRANCSVALTMVGATSAASIYYFPKTDMAATAIASRALDCGSARGYGALETLAATELMADELAAALGLDPIEFRRRNVLKTGYGPPGPPPSRPMRRHIPASTTASVSAASSGASATVRKRASPRWSWRPMVSSRSATPVRRSAPAPRRVRPWPACAGWAGRPTCWKWPSPNGPTCRWRRAAIRTR
jgi:CO/xanthine dehydrogenase Mo-binding subunit